MLKLRQIEQTILAKGKVDTPELNALRQQIYGNGKIGRQEADFLVELYKRVQHRNPAFEEFFYKVLKDHILADGRIDEASSVWLRQMLFADGKFSDEERQFLHELRGEAKHTSPEFELLFAETMRLSPEQRTCG